MESSHVASTQLIMGEREFGRFERVAEQIRKELAWVLEREMDDPRIGFVTISRVDVSKDLRNAKIFIAVREGQGAAESTRLQGFCGRGWQHACEYDTCLRFASPTTKRWSRPAE